MHEKSEQEKSPIIELNCNDYKGTGSMSFDLRCVESVEKVIEVKPKIDGNELVITDNEVLCIRTDTGMEHKTGDYAYEEFVSMWKEAVDSEQS